MHSSMARILRQDLRMVCPARGATFILMSVYVNCITFFPHQMYIIYPDLDERPTEIYIKDREPIRARFTRPTHKSCKGNG